MEEREDGELSDSDLNPCEDIEEYNPILRPNSNVFHPRNTRSSMPSSDSETSSSDSDSDFRSMPKRPKTHYSQMELEKNIHQENAVNGSRRKNNIWANVLQEEELTLEIGGVGLKKLKCDRSVESYDYTQASKMYNESKDDFIPISLQVETEEEIQKRLMRKRRFCESLGEPKKKKEQLNKPRLLPSLVIDADWTCKEVGEAIADALFEQKPQLIVKVVEVLGQEKALELYANTQKVESEGGLMIMNGSRRRTSGGVYLQLLKSLQGVDKVHLSQIFSDDKETQQWRKRKRVNRKRDRQKSGGDKKEEEGLNLKCLVTDDPGGTKCPGSTPVTSPTASDDESDTPSSARFKGTRGVYLPLHEVCEKAASELILRERTEPSSHVRQEEMETC